MKHIFKRGKNENSKTLLLLHGTGGSKRDFLPLAERIDGDAHVLAVQGNVDENGLARFFARLAEGVFDEGDLIYRTEELNEFITKAAQDYKFDRNKVVAVGYSNGANIGASLLFHYEAALAGAILLHPMVPRRNIELPDLTGVPVIVGAGLNDPLCPAQETRDLEELLDDAGAKVDVYWTNDGHQMIADEINASIQWYEENFK